MSAPEVYAPRHLRSAAGGWPFGSHRWAPWAETALWRWERLVAELDRLSTRLAAVELAARGLL